jgi:hypothetical protein
MFFCMPDKNLHINNNQPVLRRTYMMDSKLKGLAFCSVVALFSTGQAMAHTGVRDVLTQVGQTATSSYNGFTITHGCGGDTDPNSYPVIGQSAIFPFGDQVVWKESNGTVITHGGGAGIFDTIVLDHAGAPLPDTGVNLSVTGYNGVSSAFATTNEIVDSLGRVQALLWKDGAMTPSMNTVTPFKVTVPKIINNCVSAVKIRIGVINYCDVGKNAGNDAAGPYKAPKDAFGRPVPFTNKFPASGGVQQNVIPGSPVYTAIAAGNGDNNRADWWFMALDGGSALYNDAGVLQTNYWTTMTVNNSAANIALCGGATKTVTIEPTGAAFDQYLTAPLVAPFSLGATNL